MDWTVPAASTPSQSGPGCEGNEEVLRILQSSGVTVALYGWPAKADDSFVCFGAKPDKGFLDLKSRRIRKW